MLTVLVSVSGFGYVSLFLYTPTFVNIHKKINLELHCHDHFQGMKALLM